MRILTLLSFVLFTGMVGAITWWITRKDKHDTSAGYFLAGRSLSFGFIAGSLLLTNLSTEQLVGLNGAAFKDGLCVMAWEVIAGMSLVIMALFFLPRYLKSGIATVPQFLEERFGNTTRAITSLIFIIAYAGILLPIILYTGARGLTDILDMKQLTGISSDSGVIWLAVWLIGIIGSLYAIFGGLRTVAISDTINGFGLLVGGVLIIWFGLQAMNSEQPLSALATLYEEEPEKFNSLGGSDSSVPFSTLFTGVLLLNLFYWCTNQQIIQRTFGASSLKEGQKGVLLAGVFKILAPVVLVLPGIVAFAIFGRVLIAGQQVPIKDITTEKLALVAKAGDEEIILHGDEAKYALGTASVKQGRKLEGKKVTYNEKQYTVEKVLGKGVVITTGPDGANQYHSDLEVEKLVTPRRRDKAYGVLVRKVLPSWLAGFFAAVMVGAILSSFNSALNSTATLFSLGVYKKIVHPEANEKQIIHAGKIFGWIIAISSMSVAPLLLGQESIFGYLQQMNGLYFIPIFSVVLVGIVARRVPPRAANIALTVGFVVIAVGYFIPPFPSLIQPGGLHPFHFLGIVFISLIIFMLLYGRLYPLDCPWTQKASGDVDITPWNLAWPAGIGLILIVLMIYIAFADLSVIDISFLTTNP